MTFIGRQNFRTIWMHKALELGCAGSNSKNPYHTESFPYTAQPMFLLRRWDHIAFLHYSNTCSTVACSLAIIMCVVLVQNLQEILTTQVRLFP